MNRSQLDTPPARPLARRLAVLGAVGALLSITAAATALAQSHEQSRPLAPHTIEGELWAAHCLVTPAAAETCNVTSMRAGKPAGIRHKRNFVLLLVDSRMLATTCAAQPATGNRLRVRGILHGKHRAMTVFGIEEKCGGAGWKIVDMPHSGVSVLGAEGGDE